MSPNVITMRVEKNRVVSLSYTLYKDDENGEVLEVCSAEKPLEFVYAFGDLLPKFEEQIANLEEGDDFDFVLSPADAYGERTDDAVVDVPMNVFTIDGVVQKDLLVPGNEIPMRDNVGRPMNGVVVSVDESQNTVRMDFNSPLAGVTLYFSGKIESVREATEDEKQNGIRRGGGGNCGGGCGGDSCGGNSCGGCGDDEGCCGGCH